MQGIGSAEQNSVYMLGRNCSKQDGARGAHCKAVQYRSMKWSVVVQSNWGDYRLASHRRRCCPLPSGAAQRSAVGTA